MRLIHSILLTTAVSLSGCDFLPDFSQGKSNSDEASVNAGLPIILSAQPVGRTSTRNIVIRFSEPMVSASLVGKELSESLPISISPSLAGTGIWTDNSNFVFRPSQQFRRSTKYKVVLNDSVIGKKIGGDKEFSFNTPLFALRNVETFVRNPNSNIPINLDFNLEIDPKTIGANVVFETVDGEVHPYVLRNDRRSKNIAAEIQLTPNALAGRELRVHIKPELTCVDCGGNLGKKIIRTVTVNRVSPLKVKSLTAQQRSTEFTIDLRFNTHVDPEAASNFVSVVPAVKYTLVKIHRGLRLVGSFAAGNNYTVKVRAGMTGLDGRTLDTEFSKSVIIPDFEPKLSFVGQGNYIQKHGKQTLNIRSINVKGMRISVRKIHSNNLVHVVPELGGGNDYHDEYEEEYYEHSRVNTASFGPLLFSGEVPVDYVKNKPVISSIPFQQIQSQELNGVYLVEIRDKERGWTSSRRYMLATDIGMTLKVGRNENRVQLISLRTKRPIANAIVKFYSRTNEIYGTRMTNQNGVAILSGRRRESLGVITAQRGSDFSYLSLKANEISVSDFDVGGAARSKGAYEAYIYSDRGLYRPGDKARVTAIVRKPNLESPPKLPLQLEIRDPKMRLFLSTRHNTEQDGIFTHEVSFPVDALTGDYSISLMTPDGRTIGREKLQVEEFMPQRLKVSAKPQAKNVDFSKPVLFDVESSFLFGAPASGLMSTAQCLFNETSIRSPDFRSFRFSNYASSEKISRLNDRKNMDEVQLDESGKTTRQCEFGRQEKPRGPIRVTLATSVRETGGRAVSARSSGLIHPYETYVGIRQNTELSYTMVNEDSRLEALAVDRNGRPKAGQKLAVTIERENWKSVLKFVRGRYRYVSESTFAVVEEKQVTSALNPVDLKFVPKVAAKYRILVRDVKTGAQSAQEFRVSGYGNDQVEMSNPDVLSMTLDKPEYRPGEFAKVMIRAPFTGTLILTIERDTVLWTKTVPLDGNLATLSVPVTKNMLPNAFVSGQLIRGKESPEKMAPMRAYGVVPLKLEGSQHRLDLTLKAPKVMRPNRDLEVLIKVDGAKGSSFVTLAAVDEGILQLNKFKSPDPFGYFTRRRRLGVRTFDLYDLILPDVEGRATSIVRASGGDVAMAKKHVNPMSAKRVKPLALWSGLVKTSKDGWAKVKLKVPQFNGQLRLMGVAAQGSRFGFKSQSVVVRQPIVLTPTLPRFAAPGDMFEIPVDVYNGTKSAVETVVSVDAKKRLVFVDGNKKQVSLQPEQRKTVYFRTRVAELLGGAKVQILAKSTKHQSKWQTTLPIRAPRAVTTEGQTFAVKSKEPQSYTIPTKFYDNGLQTRITVSKLAIGQFGSSLSYLLRYPHGCLEQTTSRAFPLLYLSDLSGDGKSSWIEQSTLDNYVNAGIHRISSMLNGSRGFSYWPGGSWGYSSTSVYATHFLVEAKNAGYEVPTDTLNSALSHLQHIAVGQKSSIYRHRAIAARQRAYALYVLALADRPMRSENRRLYQELAKSQTADAEAWMLVNSALLAGGDRADIEGVVAKTDFEKKYPNRSGFASTTRMMAMALSLMVEYRPTSPQVAKLVDKIKRRSKNGRFRNTQENALVLTAFGKISRKYRGQDFWGTIKIDGREVRKFSHKSDVVLNFKDPSLAGKTIEFELGGKGTAFASVEVFGTEKSSLAPKNSGLEVSREYFTSDGTPIADGSVRQGQVIVTKLEVSNMTGLDVDNIALVDLLPAGLEIENPRIGDQQEMDWLKGKASRADFMDIRDDRINFYASLPPKTSKTYYYTARAVSAGEYVLPHAFTEAMYDPETFSMGGRGKLTVLGAN